MRSLKLVDHLGGPCILQEVQVPIPAKRTQVLSYIQADEAGLKDCWKPYQYETSRRAALTVAGKDASTFSIDMQCFCWLCISYAHTALRVHSPLPVIWLVLYPQQQPHKEEQAGHIGWQSSICHIHIRGHRGNCIRQHCRQQTAHQHADISSRCGDTCTSQHDLPARCEQQSSLIYPLSALKRQ